MSGIEERIAEVLQEHEYQQGFATNCSCETEGIWFWDDYRAHVAAVLVAELGLTEEWAAVDFNFAPDIEVIESTRSGNPRLAERWMCGEQSDSTLAASRRYVTGWERQS